MLRSLSTINGTSIQARNGEIGSVRDFLFDDETWMLRYVVVETGSWLASRKVLISPAVIDQMDWSGRNLSVLLTTEQVRDSPRIDTDLPVSRQQELAMSQYYGWPTYWSLEVAGTAPSAAFAAQMPEGDSHLRSSKEVSGYEVRAVDGELGTVAEFIVNDADWFIRYLSVKAGSWFSGQDLLVPTRWVERVSWPERQIFLSQERERM